MRRRLPQTPRLTQGSLADICAGGSSNNELGVRADLLERSPQSKVTIAGRSLWVQPLPLLLLSSEGFEESSRCLSSDPAPFVLMRGGEGGGKGNFRNSSGPTHSKSPAVSSFMLFSKSREYIQLPLPGFETLCAKCPLPTILAPSLLGLHASGWACKAFLFWPTFSHPLFQDEAFPLHLAPVFPLEFHSRAFGNLNLCCVVAFMGTPPPF